MINNRRFKLLDKIYAQLAWAGIAWQWCSEQQGKFSDHAVCLSKFSSLLEEVLEGRIKAWTSQQR